MKYIRTKDGIYSEEIEWTSNPPKKLALAKSNKIEELCDEFIGIYKGRHIKSLSKDLWILKDCESIYGAIWTDEGLIYVAKLNDEGEFELI